MRSEPMIGYMMDWMRTQHVTMWGGQGWTVTSDDTCRQAAEWLYDQVTDFHEWLEANVDRSN